jgi:hypothetical protein
MNKMERFDPLDEIQKLQIENDDLLFSKDEEISLSLVSMRFKSVVMQEISQLNGDTYRSMPFEDYLKIAKNIGFQEIYSDEQKLDNRDYTAKEIILFNP